MGGALMAALMGKAHHKQHKLVAHKKEGSTISGWVLETTEGEDLVQNYQSTLDQQRAAISQGARPMTPGVRAAIKAKIAQQEKAQAEKVPSEEGETEGETEGEASSGGGLDLMGLFNFLGGGASNETKDEGETGETEEETEGETGGLHKKKAHAPKKAAPEEDPTEEGAEAVKGAEEGEETADDASALKWAAKRVARRLALEELLAKVPSIPVEDRKFVRRGGKPVSF